MTQKTMKTTLILFFAFAATVVTAQNSFWNASGETVSYTSTDPNDDIHNVGIGVSAITGYRLAVDKKIRAREVKLGSTSWPDYVFLEAYELASLEEVAAYLKQHGHLKNIPSAAEVSQNGVALAQMNQLLLEKVEELTLYLLAHEQKRIQLEERIALLKKQRKQSDSNE